MAKFTSLLIIHYHLRLGGVTDVIFRATNAFFNAKKYKKTQFFDFSNIHFACGEDFSLPTNTFNTSAKNIELQKSIVTSLGYCENIGSYNQDEVNAFLKQHSSANTLWWVHNHHLGKNAFFTRDLLRFVRQYKQACILQMHDFPESARFKNLQNLQKTINLPDTYNAGQNTHFAVINKKDYTSLKKAGLRSLIIPNIIPFNVNVQNVLSDKKNNMRIKSNLNAFIPSANTNTIKHNNNTNYTLFTYPVRCIRRKNILEAALITQLHALNTGETTKLAVTLPGTSDQEKAYSQKIESLYKNNYIQGFFGIGANNEAQKLFSFSDVCKASDVIISSSVQEGFGFTYIGAASWGVPLLARKVSVTEDNQKVLGSVQKNFPSLWYEKVKIPRSVLTSAEIKNIKNAYEAKINEVCSYYKDIQCIQNDTQTIEQNLYQELLSLEKKLYIDFSMLSIDIQIRLIQESSNNKKLATTILQANKKLLKNIKELTQKKRTITEKNILKVKKNVDTFFSEKAFLHAFDKACNFSKLQTHINTTTIAQKMIKEHSRLSFLRLLLNPYE